MMQFFQAIIICILMIIGFLCGQQSIIKDGKIIEKNFISAPCSKFHNHFIFEKEYDVEDEIALTIIINQIQESFVEAKMRSEFDIDQLGVHGMHCSSVDDWTITIEFSGERI